MSKELTLRQTEILEYIKKYIKINNYPPAINEIAMQFHISTKASYDHIKALQKKKYIGFDSKKRRAIKLLIPEVFGENQNNEADNNLINIPLLGTVQAGLPILADENLEGHIKIPKELFGKGELFGIHIRGDSMNEAGILEGDIAIIKSTSCFENGEIIVASTNTGVTIKRAFKEENNLRLEPANKRYSAILTQDIKIIGKIVGLIRKYY